MMMLLDRVDYQKLVCGDEDEVEKLVYICTTSGVFYLDLTATDLWTDLKKAYEASAQYFSQPPEVKLADFQKGVERGFKQYSGNATFEIPRDDQTSGHHVLPIHFQAVESALSRISTECDSACRLILSLLSQSLSFEFEPTAGNNLVPIKEQTGTKFCYKDATHADQQTASKAHTDSGLITLLFYDQPTLQIAGKTAEEWTTVMPQAGCVVVNVADSLSERTGRQVQSPLHRVVQPAGPCKERLSAVYFLRMEK